VEQLTFGDEPAPVPVAGAAEATGYEIDRDLAAAGARCVAGVDEVGRGAWAGPVTVCAVIVRAGFPDPPAGLTDSKRLTPQRRAAIAGGPTPYHRLSWSYLDDLLQWRHLKKQRPGHQGPAVPSLISRRPGGTR
jgi:hypothetical protein